MKRNFTLRAIPIQRLAVEVRLVAIAKNAKKEVNCVCP
jgi:hypothetical protein